MALRALLHWRIVARGGQGGGTMLRRCRPVSAAESSAFKGFRFPPEVIVLAVRWYLRFGLSYRDVEELLTERGIEVDPRQRVPVGAALHAAPRGRGAAAQARRWRPVVRG
jgi:hypothetical protein